MGLWSYSGWEGKLVKECEIYWQGGEAMIMGPGWFADAGNVMDRLELSAAADSPIIYKQILSATRRHGMT